MRSTLVVLMLLCSAPAWSAVDPPPARETAADVVSAATANAVSKLYHRVAELPLSDRLTVGQYLKYMEEEEEFTRELQRADQLGGPRWIDDHTCQVRLEITATRVGLALQRIAAARPRVSPLTATQIARAIRDWPEPVISATGSSVSSTLLTDIRPRAGDPWTHVNDRVRQDALRAANREAVRDAMESVSSIMLFDQKRLGDAFATPEVGHTVREWLSRRPVTRVRFEPDLRVDVALGVDEREYFEIIRSSVGSRPDWDKQIEWQHVEQEFFAKFRPPVGRATAKASSAPVTRSALRIPNRPPDWVMQQIDVEGTAPISGSKLRSSSRAEIDARAKLRQRIEAFPLEGRMTLAEAAEQDPRIADAINRIVSSARLYRTEYRSDGTVAVRLQADMRDLWEELSR